MPLPNAMNRYAQFIRDGLGLAGAGVASKYLWLARYYDFVALDMGHDEPILTEALRTMTFRPA